MLKIAIFTDNPDWHSMRLQAAFDRRGIISAYVSLSECKITIADDCLPLHIPGFEQTLPDAVFVRVIPGGSLQQVVFYLDILHTLKILKIPVYNDGSAIERSVDKAMTSFLLANSKLATPATWVLHNHAQALAISKRELSSGHKIITKPLFGAQGKGICLLEKITDLTYLASDQGIYYLQRFVDCQGDGYSDFRVFVVNGKVIASMKRHGKSWLNNIAQGARCESLQTNAVLAVLAVRAIAALSMDYGGVDIICDQAGNYSIIEVNSIPAWKGLESVCGIDIAEALVADLLERYLSSA